MTIRLEKYSIRYRGWLNKQSVTFSFFLARQRLLFQDLPAFKDLQVFQDFLE
jgi:hypothetical protein